MFALWMLTVLSEVTRQQRRSSLHPESILIKTLATWWRLQEMRADKHNGPFCSQQHEHSGGGAACTIFMFLSSTRELEWIRIIQATCPKHTFYYIISKEKKVSVISKVARDDIFFVIFSLSTPVLISLTITRRKLFVNDRFFSFRHETITK